MNFSLVKMISKIQVVSIWICFIVGLQCCDNRPVQIKILVPDGFRGSVVLTEDAHGNKPEVRDRQVVFKVGADGRGEYQTLKWFRDWHKLSAETPSGLQIPWSLEASNVPADGLVIVSESVAENDINQVRFTIIERRIAEK